MPTATTPSLDLPPVVSREDWLAARRALLEREKAHTRAQDQLNSDRRRLPMVLIDLPYVFDGPSGKVSLLDLFAGRLQLIVYHFMWRWQDGQPLDLPCPSCSAWADQFSRGIFTSLHGRGTTLALISRAPLAKIAPFKARMGWPYPWYSSFGSSFNFDFGVSLDPAVRPVVYNYRTPEEHQRAGVGYFEQADYPMDLPGISCFLRQGNQVYHTYSTFARGNEPTCTGYQFLDLTVLGRQEPWEEPKGRLTSLGEIAGSPRLRYPDEYGE